MEKYEISSSSNRKQLSCAVIRKVKKDLMSGSTPLSDFATSIQQFCNNLVELFEVIHFFSLMSNRSSSWKRTTQIKVDITFTYKLIARFQFCKKYLIV